MHTTATCYEECVIYALQRKGLKADSFKDTDLRVFHRRIANRWTVFHALEKNGIIIPIISGSILNVPDAPAVAVVLLANDDDSQLVTVYNPLSKAIETYATDAFIKAWEETGGQCTTAFDNDGTYRPKLLDLGHMELPADLNDLLEALAENAHDRWALERQSEGWTYGRERNDKQLLTPNMLPYSQLGESEKEYDRVMAADTLRLLIALGYKIVKD